MKMNDIKSDPEPNETPHDETHLDPVKRQIAEIKARLLAKSNQELIEKQFQLYFKPKFRFFNLESKTKKKVTIHENK